VVGIQYDLAVEATEVADFDVYDWWGFTAAATTTCAATAACATAAASATTAAGVTQSISAAATDKGCTDGCNY
jgi:hypothetical protein